MQTTKLSTRTKTIIVAVVITAAAIGIAATALRIHNAKIAASKHYTAA